MTLSPLTVTPGLCPTSDARGLGGLLALSGRAEIPLPLQEVRVRASLVGAVCTTVIEQRFHNGLTTPMEAIHLFPMPEEGAITEVELRCGELLVRAECKEKAQAEATFATAREAGHRAALLTRERDDIHTLRVTNLPPGESVTVRIVLVEHLDAQDGMLRWRFPTTIAPRFLVGVPTGHGGPGVLPDTDVVPDASRLQPPIRLAGGTRLDLEVHIDGRPVRVASSLHAVSMDLSDGLRIAPSGTTTCDRDFVLAVSFAAADHTGAHAWTDGQYTLVTVEPPLAAGPQLPRDAVFVVDISGSMEGEKMLAAKRALTGALHGLMPGDRFALIAFDDRVETFTTGFSDYTDATLARADRWIKALHARGGTVMLPAIQAALAGDTPVGRVRTVLFITDGQAQDENQLGAAVAGRRRAARFFTLGIDTAVNGALLTRLARLGGGCCELATPHDDIEAVVARIESRFGSPVADEVTVTGGEAARPEPLTIFAGRPVTALLAGAPATVTVYGSLATGRLTLDVRPVPTHMSLRALWARARVAYLEDRLILRPFEEEAILPEILRVALGAGIASRCTAFVAVESTRRVTGERVEVVQPVELPAGWSEEFRAQALGFGGGGPSAGATPLGAAAPPPPPARAMRTRGAPMMKEDMLDAMMAPPAPAARPAPAKAQGAFEKLKKMANIAQAAPALDAAAEAAAPSPAAPSPAGDPSADLAATQSADGSYGQDIARTAAALVLLVLLGHTRLGGLRQRTVRKAAAWLEQHGGDARARLALDTLAASERGDALPTGFPTLVGAGAEGKHLAAWLAAHRVGA